jgi:hypothetical protein
MTKVHFHYKESPQHDWTNEELQLTRVPCIGEYVSLNMSSEWLRVYAVVHSLNTSYDVEVYATSASHVEAIKAESPLPW